MMAFNSIRKFKIALVAIVLTANGLLPTFDSTTFDSTIAAEETVQPATQTETLQNSKGTNSKPTKRSLSERLAAATRNAASVKYLLQYKFKRGEVFHWEVEHGVKTETSIQGVNEVSRSHSVSTKRWEVMDVNADGAATLVYSLVDVNMRQKVTDQPELIYDSSSNEQVPDEYKHIAEAVGLSLATIELSKCGEVVRKQTNYRDVDLGVGDFTLRLPEQSVRVGYRWTSPAEFKAKDKHGNMHRLKARKVYTLTAVKLGIATIEMRTEVLTPISDPDIESQLVQKMTDGTIKFDIDNGRVMSREINWDCRVQGFKVADSLMVYQANLMENYSALSTAAGASKAKEARRRQIKSIDDKPILRY